MQNAIVLLKSTEKCPFIIDPATAATKWLEGHLSKVCERVMYFVCVCVCVRARVCVCVRVSE